MWWWRRDGVVGCSAVWPAGVFRGSRRPGVCGQQVSPEARGLPYLAYHHTYLLTYLLTYSEARGLPYLAYHHTCVIRKGHVCR